MAEPPQGGGGGPKPPGAGLPRPPGSWPPRAAMVVPPPPPMITAAEIDAPVLEAEVVAAPASLGDDSGPPPAFPETGAIPSVSAHQAVALANLVGYFVQADYFQ